jgi:hypothetical protein
MVKIKTSPFRFTKKIIHFGLIWVMLILPIGKTFALDQTFSYLSILSGSQDLSASPGSLSSHSNYFSSLKKSHGDLYENRKVQPLVVSFDFYQASGSVASGFGIEIQRYKKSFNFLDGSKLSLEALGVLYGFNFYFRGDFWFPFLGFGTGNYSSKIQETIYDSGSMTERTIFGQVDTPFYYKLGARIPFNSWGIVILQQFISADLEVSSANENIALGGVSTLYGLYYGF